MKGYKKKEKLTPDVASVRAVIGCTWFDVNDEVDRISMESRIYSSGASKEPGATDVEVEEGLRLLKSIRKAFPPSKWVTTFSTYNEHVMVSLRKAPLTTREKAVRKQKTLLAKLRGHLHVTIIRANERTSKQSCRDSFSYCVCDGRENIQVSIKVVFGRRLLYPEHDKSGFCFADKEVASEAIESVVDSFPEYAWTRTEQELRPFYTHNCSPPNNVIELEGCIEYVHQIRKVR